MTSLLQVTLHARAEEAIEILLDPLARGWRNAHMMCLTYLSIIHGSLAARQALCSPTTEAEKGGLE